MSSTTAEQLPPAIRELLERFVRRRRRVAAARAVGIAVALAALWLLSWGVVDRLFPLHWIVRCVLLLKLAAIVLMILIRPLRALLRREIDWPEAARQIERRDPRFGEALATVVSQRTNGSSGRVSPQLVEHLSRQVASQLGSSRHAARTLVRLRPAATALIAAFAAAFILFDLSLWPWLGLRQLLARQVAPLASVPPVTTSRLDVISGSTQVVQGRPLTLIARVEPPDSIGPTLRTTIDGRTWSSIPMTAASDGSLFVTLPSITRDMRYQVVAGDASSGVFDVRVLRQPVVRELRIRLTYPAYIGREPLELSAPGGMIEAPAGSRAAVSIIASEPLGDAWLTIGGRRLDSQPTSDPHVRQAEVPIDSDATCSIELLSDRGVRAGGTHELLLRAIPDRPPISRSLFGEGPWVMRPDDAMELAYQAADDYGVAAIEAHVQINRRGLPRVPLAVGSDPRRIEGVFRVELATLGASAGDLIDVTLWAADRAGQTASAPPCRIIVGSQTVGPRQRRAETALRQAAKHARAVASQLAAAQGEPSRPDARLAAAAETAPLVGAALLSAMTDNADHNRVNLLAGLIDAALVQACRIDALSADVGEDALGATGRAVAELQAQADQIAQRVEALWQAQLASMVAAMRTVGDEAPAEAAEHLAPLLAADAAALGLDPAAEDFARQLQARIDAGEKLTASARPFDPVSIARQWSGSSKPAAQLLPERLASAAQVLERRGQPREARDLRLASRAARNIDARLAPVHGPGRDMRDAYVAALSTLVTTESPDAGAERARQAMRNWAGELETAAATQDSIAAPAAGPESRRRTDPATQRARATEAGGNQQQALAAIRRAQEALARMPELLDRTVQAGDWLRQTQQRARDAARAVEAAAPEQQPAARRALAVAQAQLAEASKALSDVAQSLDPDYTWMMARELEAIAPQTSPAVAPMQQELAPALETLADAVHSGDMDVAGQATGDARDAIALVQDGLREARQAMLERDPLVAARWFAQQAGADPAAPPDLPRPRTALAAHERDRPADWRETQLDPGSAETDLPGYQDALRLYFQLLGESKAE